MFASDRVSADSYSSLVRIALGAGQQRILQATLSFGCLGFEVVYLNIVSDLLLGQPPYDDGLLTAMLPEDWRCVTRALNPDRRRCSTSLAVHHICYFTQLCVPSHLTRPTLTHPTCAGIAGCCSGPWCWARSRCACWCRCAACAA
jgi:hypothetical protein